MGIVVCKDCAIAHHAVSDFVTAEAWNAICEGLRRAGKVEPTFDLTTIDFIDADDTRWDPAIAKREADPAHTITVAGGAKA